MHGLCVWNLLSDRSWKLWLCSWGWGNQVTCFYNDLNFDRQLNSNTRCISQELWSTEESRGAVGEGGFGEERGFHWENVLENLFDFRSLRTTRWGCWRRGLLPASMRWTWLKASRSSRSSTEGLTFYLNLIKWAMSMWSIWMILLQKDRDQHRGYCEQTEQWEAC